MNIKSDNLFKLLNNLVDSIWFGGAFNWYALIHAILRSLSTILYAHLISLRIRSLYYHITRFF